MQSLWDCPGCPNSRADWKSALCLRAAVGCGESRASWDNSVSGQLIGDGFQGVVQQVADVADVEAGARADFLVGQLFVELEANQFPAAVVEGFQAEPHQADAFPAGDLLIRQRLRVGSVIGGRRPRVAGRD